MEVPRYSLAERGRRWALALRPSFLVALLINVINVFNSFPIIWEMTQGGPGHETATTTVFMYQLKQA